MRSNSANHNRPNSSSLSSSSAARRANDTTAACQTAARKPTTGGSLRAGGGHRLTTNALPIAAHHHQHHHRKSAKVSACSKSSADNDATHLSPDTDANNLTRLNKCEVRARELIPAILAYDQGGSAGSIASNDNHRKQNHCEIEKRRRDKMNHYILELASVIPSFNSNQSKLDKLTVLRMAVQHVKTLRSSLCSFSSFHLRPSFLSSGNLLKNLILQMASQEAQDNLFMVVTCDRGKVLFVSQSSKDILNHDQNELVGQCLFDILHKDDVSKVKEQISYFSLRPKEMLVDSKTLQPIKRNQRQSFINLQNQSNSTPQPGARRSFFCRMKSGRILSPMTNKTQSPSSNSAHKSNSRETFDTGHQASQRSNAATNDLADRESKNSKLVDQQRSQQQPVSINNKTTTTSCTMGSSLSKKSNSTVSAASADCADDNSEVVNSLNERVNNRNSDTAAENKICAIEGRSQSKQSIGFKQAGGGSVTSNRGTSLESDGSSLEASGNSDQVTCNEGSSFSLSSNKIRANNGCKIRRDGSYAKTPPSSGNGNSTGIDSQGSLSSSSSSSRKKQWRYVVMHCTGYLKSITLRNGEYDDDDFDDCNSENNSSDDEENSRCKTINCLVAVCRRSVMDRDLKPDRPLTFTCRYSMEGKFVFVDQRTTVALGYTPQQLLGTSHYAYCHKDSVDTFKECHRQCILNSEAVSSDIYQFKRANGQHLWLQTSLKSFRNPWTKFIDYIVANHTTAEGNDPHYNEGCVPTKFNQDMTGEASQSSSPASSSSISLPSVDSKKSTSPSSSSIGSSYSMESYASGGSIQALLNQIDRVKSGGVKYSLDFHKKRNDGHAIGSSGSSSARKSNEDSGNFSDLQSCSSVSSQNSAQSAEFINLQGVNNFVNNVASVNNPTPPTSNQQQQQRQQQQQQQQQQQVVASLPNQFYNQKVQNSFRSTQAQQSTTNYQQSACRVVCPPMTRTQVDEAPGFATAPTARDNTQEQNLRTNTAAKSGGPRIALARVNRSMIGSIKPNQRPTYQYPYRHNQSKSASSNSSDTGHESGSWSSSSGSAYSSSSGHHATDRQNSSSATVCEVPENQATSINKLHASRLQTAYVMQTQTQPMSVMQTQAPMQSRTDGYRAQCDETTHSSDLMRPVGSYMTANGDVNSRYATSDVDMEQVAQSAVASGMQTNMTMTLNQQHSRQQQQSFQGQPHHSHSQAGPVDNVNVSMIWNTTDTNSTPYQNVNIMHNAEAEQIACHQRGDVTLTNMDVGNSNNQLIAQQMVHCPQCINHKCCSNQPLIMANNGDLNSINLTSLAVEGDLDEVELLECLAVCEPPESQLYNIQNNTYPQYNI